MPPATGRPDRHRNCRAPPPPRFRAISPARQHAATIPRPPIRSDRPARRVHRAVAPPARPIPHPAARPNVADRPDSASDRVRTWLARNGYRPGFQAGIAAQHSPERILSLPRDQQPIAHRMNERIEIGIGENQLVVALDRLGVFLAGVALAPFDGDTPRPEHVVADIE